MVEVVEDILLEVEEWPSDLMEEEEIHEKEINEECVEVEHSEQDESEVKRIENFFNSKCCVLLCNSVIPKELIIQHRERMQELDNHEKDIVVLSSIHFHQRIPELNDVYHERSKRATRTSVDDTAVASSSTNTSRRNRMKYFFAGLEVCKSFYLFANDIGTKRYANLVKHHRENGVSLRKHKLTNSTRTWGNVILPNEIETVVEFIKSYGEKNGMPLPGRVPRFKNFDVIKLSSDVTKKLVWEKYMELPGVKKIAVSTFREIWDKYCPYVTITKPARRKTMQ